MITVGMDECPKTQDSARGLPYDIEPPSSAAPSDEADVVYVAAAQQDWQRARRAMRILRECGFTVSHDWSHEVEEHQTEPATPTELAVYAQLDLDGVRDADVVLCLTPERYDHGCGLYGELGMAVALGKRVIVTGPNRDRCIFAHLAERFETDLEGIEAML